MGDINRFVTAQEGSYSLALEEIKSGKKMSHWIWYIFPQMKGLGHSYNSNYYGIEDAQEAQAYLNHPVLSDRLREITEALLCLPSSLSARDILGSIDARKVKSCMTLFYYVSEDPLFAEALNRFYHGEVDYFTWYALNDKLNRLRQLYKERCDECNEIIESLGYYEATRDTSPHDIPLCFTFNDHWLLLDGFGFDEEGYFMAHICDLRSGPPDLGEIDAIAVPDYILEKTISILDKRLHK